MEGPGWTICCSNGDFQRSDGYVTGNPQNGVAKQLFVDGKPFIMLAGELHNSDASSEDFMKPVWERLSDLHLNTVIGSASWELVEPTEGHFDFGPVDSQVAEARKRGMHLVLICFATWKNAGSG